MEVINAPAVADVPVPPFVPGPEGTHITIRGLTKYFAGWPLAVPRSVTRLCALAGA